MLERLHVKGFKSLRDVDVKLAPLVVLFGPNAAGKSNLLEATQLLARLGTERTLSEAFGPPLRGQQLEMFSLPAGGLAAVLDEKASVEPRLRLEADIRTPKWHLRYAVGVHLTPRSGELGLYDERLDELSAAGEPGAVARIEKMDDREIAVRQRKKGGPPRHEKVGLHHTILSNPQYAGVKYPAFEPLRAELLGWRVYYLDPRVAMRADQSPREVDDIGPLGQWLAPFLYRVKSRDPRRFSAMRRALQAAIPSVTGLDVDLDPRRGTLDVQITQDDMPVSSRIVSEGTLRILALSAIAGNPWPGSLVAFEEPENGVHPRRIEVIAQLLWSIMQGGQQVLVTTHSPVFVAAMARLRDQAEPEDREKLALLRVGRNVKGTIVSSFNPSGPLFQNQEVLSGLRSAEDGLIEAMLVRGWLDG